MMGLRKLLLTLALGWLAGSATPLVAAQESAPGEEQADQDVGPASITDAEVEAGLTVLAASTDLNEEDRAKAEAEWKAAGSRLVALASKSAFEKLRSATREAFANAGAAAEAVADPAATPR